MSDGKTNPLSKCARCGRTQPRPLPIIWPATVWCVCGVAKNYPEPISPEQAAVRRQTMQRINARRGRNGAVKAQDVDTPERAIEERLDGSTHVPEGGASVPPGQRKRSPAGTDVNCTGKP